MPTLLALLVAVLVLAGCAGTRTTLRADEVQEAAIATSPCEPATSEMQPPTFPLEPPPATPEADQKESLAWLSPAAREMAVILGVEDLVAEIPALETAIASQIADARLRLIEVRQELSDRLLLALFEASSTAAELECEKTRAEELAARLEEVQGGIQQERTIWAILSDSASGVLSGGFLLAGSEVVAGLVDLVGSVLALTFGYSALGGDQQNQLLHSRNLLAEAYAGPTRAELFPDSVWRFLNWPVAQQGPRSRREALVASWQERLGKPGSKDGERQRRLFFGQGGIYQPEELRHRGEMIGQLRSAVNLMSQDLNQLFRETLRRLSSVRRIGAPPP